MTDESLMRRALFHAQRAAGATTPNPMVGAVVVSADGIVVGQGRHPRAGEPHAEIFALEEAGERARGGTLYVTLEPCCHHGRTPPCTTRIIASGIRRVVAAVEDPYPLMRGKGIRELREAGLEVEVGLLAEEACRLNRAYITVQTLGRPEVVVKAAVSQDRKIAAGPGVRTPISSEEAHVRTHQLRAVVDAIGIGSGTVLVDDPLLTARGPVRARPLVRIVFDRRLRTPPGARLFSTLSDGPVIILTSQHALDADPSRARDLEKAGATLVAESGSLDAALRGLLRWEVSALLVEGGAIFHRALFDAGLVDVAHVIVGPQTLGPSGIPVFGGGRDPLDGLQPRRVESLGRDVWMEFDVHGNC